MKVEELRIRRDDDPGIIADDVKKLLRKLGHTVVSHMSEDEIVLKVHVKKVVQK